MGSVEFDLRRYEREQAHDAGLWESQAEGIALAWTDEIMSGGKANGFTLHDLILDYLTSDDLVPLFTRKPDAFENAEKKLRERIKEFFMSSCESDIWDVITDRDGDEA